MNFEKFRRTGELSDITVIVDKTEFKLHTFPLFTKSDYFKKAVESTHAPYVIRLDNDFPGGAEIFNQLADYLYSIPITIDHKNIVPLRSAACFIQCESLGTLLDKRFDEILLVARAKSDLGIPLILLEQCTGEYQQWSKQARIVDKCLESIIETLTRGSGIQLTRSDREIIIRLPLEWVIELIKLCPKDCWSTILPIVKHFVTTHVLEQNQSEQSEGEDKNSIVAVAKKEKISLMNGDEKREIIDRVVQTLGDTVEQYPLIWLNSLYEKSIELKCESEQILSSHITQIILRSKDFATTLDNIPDDVMARLLERVNKHKDEHVKDPQSLAKLTALIDSYVEQLRQRGTLTSEQFVKLASCIPKENRSSYDSLLLGLDEILKNEKSTQLSSSEREELLNQVDFSRVNEETIAACKSNKLIPQQLIADAALALCSKLRKQLNETRNRLHILETELAKSRPMYSSSSIYSEYSTRQYDSALRSPTRSRPIYTTNYDSPRSNSIYTYSRYDYDTEVDFVSPSRYFSSASSSRFPTYSKYRH